MCDLQMRKDTRINSQTHPIKHLNNRGLDSNKNKHASCRYIQLSSLDWKKQSHPRYHAAFTRLHELKRTEPLS